MGHDLMRRGAADVDQQATGEPSGTELMRMSTDAAALCKQVVIASSVTIQGRKHVRVEGWQAIALAHGCVASAGSVRKDGEGWSAIGTVRRISDGKEIATGDGYVGDDEKTWRERPVFAKRAMAQTRAISRACRAAFAHVVVMMNAGLATTPAEEQEGWEGERAASPPPPAVDHRKRLEPPVRDASWESGPEPPEVATDGFKRSDDAGQILARIAAAGAADKEAVLKEIVEMPDGPAKNEARKAYGGKKWGA